MQRDALIPGMKSFSSPQWRRKRGAGGYYTPQVGATWRRSIIADAPRRLGLATVCAAAFRLAESKAPYAGSTGIRIRGQAQHFSAVRWRNLPQSTPDHVDAAVAKLIRKRGVLTGADQGRAPTGAIPAPAFC